jgi:hypothetical protein
MPGECAFQRLAPDCTLPHHPPCNPDYGHTEVELGKQARIGVDVTDLWLDPQRAQQLESLIAQVTAFPSDQLDPHKPKLIAARRNPCLGATASGAGGSGRCGARDR